MKTCDLFVIGGGSGGVRAARLAAAKGAQVVLAENTALGGTCVNVGCVPKKLFFYAAGFSAEAALAPYFGWPECAAGGMDWPTLRENKNREILRLNDVYEKILKDADVRIINKTARLAAKKIVHIGDETYQAEKVLLAMGGAPLMASIVGKELAVCSDDMFHLPALPKQAAIIGGGYIALEFAGILSGLGVQTTLCYRAELPLRGFDGTLRHHAATEMTKHGIALRPQTAPKMIKETTAGKRRLYFDNDEIMTADLVLMATGRQPQTRGLIDAGVVLRKNGTVETDDNYETAAPGVFAIGDLLQTPALTPVATAEADIFVARVFGGDKTARLDYENIPTAVFCRPPLATVGLGEEAAKSRGIKTKIYCSTYRPLRHSMANSGTQTMMKLVVDSECGRVVGAHMAGEDAGEIIQGLAIAIRLGATKDDFDSTVGVHPTNAEEFVTMRDSPV